MTALLGLMAALLLAGCAQATTSDVQATATLAPTATATATPQTTVTAAQVAQACGSGNFGTTGYYQVGDLYIQITFTPVSYPSRELPAGTPLSTAPARAHSDCAKPTIP